MKIIKVDCSIKFVDNWVLLIQFYSLRKRIMSLYFLVYLLEIVEKN
jgi:hypothetical protein